MEMLHGLYIFSQGDRLVVRDKKEVQPFMVVAVKQIKDSDCCFGCCFYMKCRSYPGNSPFSRSCYDTIFITTDDLEKKIDEGEKA